MRLINARWVLVALALVAGRASAAGWVDANSETGQYVAKFPVKPMETTQAVKTALWKLTNHSSSIARKDGFEWSIIWCDYPPEVAQSPDGVYSGIIKGYKTDGKKTVLSEKKITISGHAGHELEVTQADGSYHRVRFVMAGERLYEAMAYAPAGKGNDPEVMAFFDSFSIRTVHDFPTRGFRIAAEMAGWRRVANDKAKTAITWGLGGAGAGGLEAMVTVESGKATAGSGEEMAKSLAAAWGGKVLGEKVMLDGEAAYRVEAANAGETMKPVEALVVVRKGLMYLVMGGTTSGRACHEQMEEVRKGWKWEEAVGISEHLAMMAVPRLVLGNAALMNYPRDMYENPTQTPGRVVDLSLPEGGGSGPFQAFVQLAALPETMEFATMAENFLKQVNGQKLAEMPWTWTARKGDESRLVTAAFHSAAASELAKGEAQVKWAMIKLDKTRVVLINFTIGGANGEERKRYEAAAEGIVDSVEAVKVP